MADGPLMIITPGPKKDQLAHYREVRDRGLVGEVWECGVYQGETAIHLAALMAALPVPPRLRLFDTFTGMPPRTVEDAGGSTSTFDDCPLARVQRRMEPFISRVEVCWHVGWLPDTFKGLEDAAIQFAYVDLDLYASTQAALAWVWPRLVPGGRVVLDDATYPDVWPGVKRAAEESGLAWQEDGCLWWVDKPVL